MTKKMVNGVIVDLTPTEQAEYDAMQQAWIDGTQQRIDDELDAIADQVMENRGALKAFALVMLQEINTLRADHGRPAYTAQQLKTAVRNRING